MKKIFKEAHKLTKEMVKKYNTNYQAQFQINLSYLLEEKGGSENGVRGTEKQIKYANDILEEVNKNLQAYRNGIDKYSKEHRIERNLRVFAEVEDMMSCYTSAADVINDFKQVLEGENVVQKYYLTLEKVRIKVKVSALIMTKVGDDFWEIIEAEEKIKYGL